MSLATGNAWDAPSDVAVRGLRVTIVLDAPRVGGAERVALQIAAGAAQAGADCFLYLLKPKDGGAELDLPDGVKVRRIKKTLGATATLRRLADWIANDKPDVIHAHNSAAFAYAFGPARWCGRRIVVTRHGRLVGRRSRYELAARCLYPFADAVIQVAHTLDNDLPWFTPPLRLLHIPNGVSPHEHDARQGRARLAALCCAPLDSQFILCVGTISREKNQAELVRAMRQVAAQHPNAHLVLAGGARNDACTLALKTAVEASGFASRIHAVGPQRDICELMAGCDVFCLPSKTEALPLALLEAMMQACPIVATVVGDVPAALRHDREGLLVPAGNESALADLIGWLLRNRASAASFGDAARRRALRDHAEQRMIDHHLALYTAYVPAAVPEAQPHVA